MPGNEASKVANALIDYLDKEEKKEIEDNIASDELDVQEVKETMKSILKAIVALTEYVKASTAATISEGGVDGGEGEDTNGRDKAGVSGDTN